MPVDYRLYPPDWPRARAIVRARSHGQCECTGECGLHQPNPTPRRCTERHHKPARWAKGTIRLTCAHLCNCQPLCAHPAHLKDLCQRCHLRFDRFRHAAARLRTQAARKKAQETLPTHPS